MKRQSILFFSAVGMLILILDGQTAISGVREGIDLCIRTLIPSLFPFFVLSVLLTGTLVGHSSALLSPIGKVCGIPKGTESLLSVGFLGGYPVGAQNIGQAFHNGQLSKADAERMLAFCSNAGPAFLFGMIGPLFSDRKMAWILWAIHILSDLLTGIITGKGKKESQVSVQPRHITLPSALESAVRSMAFVCGWVILFRMVLQFLDRWLLWLLPGWAQVLISGVLELSNGCILLQTIDSEGLRFILSGVMLAFGGLCVTMQTASAVSGLTLRYYLPGKLFQSCTSFLLSAMFQILFPENQRFQCHILIFAAVVCLSVVLAIILAGSKKISSIPATSGV